jgi:hypothetical protein
LSFFIDTWFIVFNPFVAFLLSVVQYFAIDTEFTIFCSIGALILLRQCPVVESTPVEVLASCFTSSISVILRLTPELLFLSLYY